MLSQSTQSTNNDYCKIKPNEVKRKSTQVIFLTFLFKNTKFDVTQLTPALARCKLGSGELGRFDI